MKKHLEYMGYIFVISLCLGLTIYDAYLNGQDAQRALNMAKSYCLQPGHSEDLCAQFEPKP